MSKVKDVKVNKPVDLEVEVVSVEAPRNIEKYGRKLSVANANVRDETGSIKLSLWNDQITKVKAGMRLKLLNVYPTEYQGNMQLSIGKYGKMEVI